MTTLPKPTANGVLIQVKKTDVNTHTGWYSKSVTEATTGNAYTEVTSTDAGWGGAGIQFPRIKGADVVGTVVAVGEQAGTGLIRQQVMSALSYSLICERFILTI